MKESQLALVADELLVEGFISRNFCLKRFISRLGAYICELKKYGIDIDGRYEGNDYVYYFTGPREQRKILKKLIKG